MKRIGSTGASLLLVGLLVAVLAVPAWGAYKAEYKMSVRTTQTSPWGAGAQKFADIVREKSGGHINIKVYFNGALFADDQTKEFMLTKQGVADFALGSTINWSPQLRVLNLFNLPFMFPSYEALDAVKNGTAGRMIKAQMDKFGVVFLGWGENGYRELTNRVHPVVTPDDMNGLKVRAAASPIFIDTFKAMGANPVLMNWGDALTALQQGTIDAQENPVNVIIIPYKIFQMHKYITVWHYAIDPLILGVSKLTWDTFSAADKKMMQQAVDEAMRWELTEARDGLSQGGASYKKLEADGMTVTYLTPAQIKVFQDRSRPVYDKWTKEIGEDVVKAAFADIAKVKK
jgi:tripartite ATP-independent transporter DctP family solute receptor